MPTDQRGRSLPEIVFWSDFPLGFHNREAEEKMARFAARGYTVHYVEKLGIRNPRLRHLPWMLRALTRRGGGDTARAPFRVIAPKVAFPRRAPLVPALNRRLLERQVVSHLADPSQAVFWVRYPSPELPPLIDRVGPRLVVYEAVDHHERGPGITPRLQPLLRATEEAIVARAGLVFTWSEPLRARFAASHPRVVLAGPATELERFTPIAAAPGEPQVAVWTGAIDFRFDADLLAAVARCLPGWRFLIAGPVLDREARGRLAAVRNVELLGVVDPAEVPALVARASVCVMPYRESEFTDMLFPIKLVEYLAAGRPVVSTPIRIAREMSDVVGTATGPQEFAEAIEYEAARDSGALRRARSARTARYTWDARIDEMERALQEALDDG